MRMGLYSIPARAQARGVTACHGCHAVLLLQPRYTLKYTGLSVSLGFALLQGLTRPLEYRLSATGNSTDYHRRHVLTNSKPAS